MGLSTFVPVSGPIADIELVFLSCHSQSSAIGPASGPIAELWLSDPPDEKRPNPDKSRNPGRSGLPAHNLDLLVAEIRNFQIWVRYVTAVTGAGFVPGSGPIAELWLSDPPDEKRPNPDKPRNLECSDLPAHDLDLILVEIQACLLYTSPSPRDS